jgi:alcohol dehydrogenase (NADP+)
MLCLANENDLYSIIETIDISEDGCKSAVEKVKDSAVRYRVMLTGSARAFGNCWERYFST